MELVTLMDTGTATVFVALITLAGTMFTVVFSYLGRKEARGANRAVNNVDSDMPKLYDIVAKTQEDLYGHVARNKDQHDDLYEVLNGNRAALEQHVKAGGAERAEIRKQLQVYKDTRHDGCPFMEERESGSGGDPLA